MSLLLWRTLIVPFPFINSVSKPQLVLIMLPLVLSNAMNRFLSETMCAVEPESSTKTEGWLSEKAEKLLTFSSWAFLNFLQSSGWIIQHRALVCDSEKGLCLPGRPLAAGLHRWCYLVNMVVVEELPLVLDNIFRSFMWISRWSRSALGLMSSPFFEWVMLCLILSKLLGSCWRRS